MRLTGLVYLLMSSAPLWALDTAITNYGAVGDGRSDSTAAIVQASRAVAENGGTLYIPEGVYLLNPHAGHLILGNNMTVSGPGTIRITAGVGDFDYVMGPAGVGGALSNVTLSGLTVDENIANNPSTIAPTASQAQTIVLGHALNGLKVRNVTFYLSGLYAIKLQDNLDMADSKVVFQARGNAAWFDNSAIYMPTQHSRCSITNNQFIGQTSIANTAIEVHSTDVCTISNNSFDNYRIALLPLDSYGLSFSGNTVTRAEYAVSLWAESQMQNVTISDNTIALNNAERQKDAAAGIALYWCSSCEATGSFHNITIQGNRISFQPEVRSNVDPSAYWGIGIMPAGSVDTVHITGNTITNAPIRGITVGNSQRPGASVSNVVVENNTLISPGNNTAQTFYESGIALQGTLRSVTVQGNTIRNTVDPFTGRYGIWSDPGGSYSNVSVRGNDVDSAYLNPLASSIAQ